MAPAPAASAPRPHAAASPPRAAHARPRRGAPRPPPPSRVVLPQALDLARLRFEAAERVEQAPMRRRIDQRALIMLPVNFDQRSANGLHGLHAHRLIIDEG